MTATHLLRTKIGVPLGSGQDQPRERLLRRLDLGRKCRLTVITGPAGFGKTTAVAQWTRSRVPDAAWVQLDEPDNDPARFWSYLLYALEAARLPGLMQRMSPLLHNIPHGSVYTLIDVLLTELAQLPGETVLVLDDMHVIQDPAVYEPFVYFVENADPRLHLFLLSRSELPLPSVKWELRGLLQSVEPETLLFTREEAADYYKQAEANLTGTQIGELFRLTEGWPAGLQLAALTLARGVDPKRLISGFGGARHRIADYLLNEVFAGLSEELRRFMLDTCVLDRMDTDLCDRLTGRDGGGRMLDVLRRMNLFLIPIGDEGGWFRYHHLFLDFLRAQAALDRPGKIRRLRRAAGEALAGRGIADEAAEHYLAAGEYDLAVRLLMEHLPAFLARGETGTLLRLAGALDGKHPLPPLLALLYAFTLSAAGQQDAAARVVERFEAELDTMAPGEERKRWSSALFFVKGNMLVNTGRYKDWLEETEQLAADLPEIPLFFGFNYNTTEPYVRRTAFGLKGVLNEDTDKVGQGIVQVLEAHGWRDSLMNSYVIQSLGEGYYEWNRLEEAEVLLKRSEASGRRSATAGLLVPSLLMQAKIRLAARRYAAAHAHVDEVLHAAESWQETHWRANLLAFRAYVELREGRTRQAELTLARIGLPDEGRPTLDKFLPFLAASRLLALGGRDRRALELLEELERLSIRERELSGRVEAVLLQAWVHYRADRPEEACRRLDEALALGAPNGYVRTFLDEGGEILGLLRLYVGRHGAPDGKQVSTIAAYARRLLGLLEEQECLNAEAAKQGTFHRGSSGFGGLPGGSGSGVLGTGSGVLTNGIRSGVFSNGTGSEVLSGGTPGIAAASQGLSVGLTPKETEIMHYVMNGLTNQEIADTLSITVGTVKIHLNRIYGKLQVKSRTQAVRRCRELGWG